MIFQKIFIQYLVFLSIIALSSKVIGQNYNMPTASTQTVNTCSGNFYDSGGSGSNYSSGETGVITFCPSTPGSSVKLTFTSFNTEPNGSTACYDYMEVFYGSSATGTGQVICGTPTVPFSLVAPSGLGGCITIRFRSDNLVTRAGWAATISCVTPCSVPTAVINDASQLNLCNSAAQNPSSPTVSLNASNSTTPSGTITTYSWNFGDGTTQNTSSPTTTKNYTTPGIYPVKLTVTNSGGCISTNSATKLVRVLPSPTISDPNVSATCGNCANVSVTGTPQTAASDVPTGGIGAPLVLPDISGGVFTSTVDLSGLFPAGATMTAGCYPTLCFDLDHSYSGDLRIELVAPNGTAIRVFDQIGGGTNFGRCTPPADDEAPGCPRTYCVASTATTTWGSAPTNSGASCTASNGAGCNPANELGVYYTAGTYLPSQPFSGLVGAPLNGVWTLRITDFLSADDGTIHSWSLNFPGSCYSNLYQVTPSISSIAVTPTGTAPALTSQSSTPSTVTNPGPDACPPGLTCTGSQLVQSGQACFGAGVTGTFSYNYLVTDEYGCQFPGSLDVSVTCPCPIVSSFVAPVAQCLTGNSFSFTPTSTGVTAGTTTYSWNFGDGTPATTATTSTAAQTHTYASAGTYSVTLTTANGAGCVKTYSANITVNASTTPTFTQLGPYCKDAIPGILPANSTNATPISGTWNPTTISTANAGSQSYTFTPSASAAGTPTCATTAPMTITVNALTTPTFNQLGPYCKDATPGSLPANSTNATPISGTWNPTTISTAAVGSQTYTFTPSAAATGSPTCATTASMTITVNALTTPTFTQLGPYCKDATPGSLPANSTNATPISGTWNPSTISTTTAGSQTYTFTPLASAAGTPTCATTATMTITINDPTTPTFTQLGPYCKDATPGSLPANSTNATPISGTWNPTTISTATAGSQSYTFTPSSSAAGTPTCATTATMTITINEPTTPTFTQLGPYCKDATPGSLPANSTNATPISGTWNPTTISTATVGSQTYTFTPSAAAAGTPTCATTATMTITINEPTTPTFTQLGPYCKDATPGSLPANSTNATPISGTWNPTTISTANAGSQTYTFTPSASAAGTPTCATTATMTIVINAPTIPTFTQLGPYCKDATPGSLPLSSTNATPISGTWNPTTILTSSVGSQTYTFTPSASATGTPTCATTATMNISIISLPTVSVNSPTVCFGNSATVTATPSPSGTYNYTWTVPNSATNPGNVASFSTSISGTYSVIISTTSTPSCSSSSATSTVTISPQPPAPTGLLCYQTATWTPSICDYTITGTQQPPPNVLCYQTATWNSVSCSYDVTGIAPTVSINSTLSTIDLNQPTQLTASGNPAGGTYSWSPTATLSPTTGPTVSASPTDTTTYTVTYDIGNNCTATASTTISVNPITLSIAVTNSTICSGTPTTLTATPSVAGGTYLWSPGGQTTQTITVSPNSNIIYSCVYTLSGQTANSNPTSITVLPKPVISVNSPTICTNQSATLNVTANPGGGTYLWNPGGQTTSSLTVSPISTSNYTVIYTLNGCSDTATSVVTVNPTPTVTVNNQTICAGETTTLTASPSISGGTFLWSSSQNTSVISVSPTTTTTYNVLYTISGCNATGSGTVTVNTVPNVSVTNATICAGESATLTATPTITGGTYSWINPTSTSNSITVSPQSTSTYSLTYTVNGCTSPSASGTVTVNPIPTVSINNTSICIGESATLTASPSIPGGSYLWTPNGQTGSSIVVSPTTTSNFVVTYTLNGCESSPASAVVTVNPKPTISFSADTLLGCAPLTVNFSNNNPNQSSCSWSMGNGQSVSGCNSNYTFIQGGCYDITLTASENGCSNSMTLQDYICVESLPDASFTIYPNEFTQDNQTISFNNTSTGATSYSWDFGDDSYSNQLNPDHLFINTLQGYLVTLTAYAPSGCLDQSQIFINYNEGEIFYVPNTFTPDGDNFNQTFKPIFTSGFDPYNFEMFIYNRWGELIFETHDATRGWDGSYGMDGRDVQQGIYTYKIMYKNPKLDERKMIVGHVTLMR
jgi:gliding motility-associated-like protein